MGITNFLNILLFILYLNLKIILEIWDYWRLKYYNEKIEYGDIHELKDNCKQNIVWSDCFYNGIIKN